VAGVEDYQGYAPLATVSDENAEEPASVIARPNSQLVPGSINQLGVIEWREGA